MSKSMFSNRQRWSGKILVLLASLSLIGALFVWFANYNDFWKFFDEKRRLTVDNIYQQMSIIDDRTEKVISAEESIERRSENQPQENHQAAAFVEPIKMIVEFEKEKIVGSETAETEYVDWSIGTFRDPSAKFWDPNPEYTFDAFDRHFHLVLTVSNELTPSDLKVTYVSKNYSAHQEPAINLEGCFYSGFIKGESNSEISVSLCNGMRGYIISETGGYYIEPAVEVKNDNNADTFLHRLSRIRAERTSSTNGECVVHQSANHVPISDHRNSPMNGTAASHNHIRRKRSTDEYTIELMVVVDKNVADFHGPSVEHYVLLLLNTVRSLFKDQSIGARINIVVVNVTVFHHDVFQIMKGTNESTLLTEFCAWQANEKIRRSHRNERTHDTAILLTRENFCIPTANCSHVIGFANVGSICGHEGNYSCALIKENGHLAAFTIAHELGHLLNMSHDDLMHCNLWKNEINPGKIMTRQMTGDSEPWTWSSCSRHHLNNFLQTGDVECLYDNPNEYKFMPRNLIGEHFTSKEQCEFLFGRGSIPCKQSECLRLYCLPLNDSSCHTDGRAWADGTPCKDGVNYWCKRRQCIPKNYQVPIIHGGWGEWQPYSECSRSCGGGVRSSNRECNNPEPSETGEYCKGVSIQYESCNTHECPKGTQDIRAKQCAELNEGNVIWIPAPHRRDGCKLTCYSNNGTHRFVGSVIDGTPCNSSTFHICVNGKCLKAGCDHVLNSTSVLDKCGVCAGDNTTCTEVTKRYDITDPRYGYNFVAIIPVGSWDLNIRQYSFYGGQDSNYLALRDPENNAYLFNGEMNVKRKLDTISYDGLKFEYSGVEGGPPESVNSSSRLHKNLILEVLSVNNVMPFYVECRYKMSNPQYFLWEVTNEWTTCNKVCFGQQKRIVRCIRKETGNIVAYESCAGLEKPPSETRNCNEFCYLKWKEVWRSDCFPPCGEGVQKVSYGCFQEHRNIPITDKVKDSSCYHLKKPPETIRCSIACDKARWHYYEWEPCSVTCGTGIQMRRAECVDQNNRLIDESMCSRVPKKIENNCYLDECPHWSTDEWSPCSVSCGAGMRKRKYWCEQRNRVVANNLCPAYDRPNDTETCQMPACSAVWIAGEWSPCSVTCGSGTVYRSVRCSDRNEARCPLERKPAETQTCYLPNCESDILVNDVSVEFEWRTGDWGKCSASCGKGIRRRLVECYNTKTNELENYSSCQVSKGRPHDEEPCELQSCARWRTTAWHSCSVSCGQGTRRRYAWCEMNGRRALDVKCTDPKPNTMMPCDPIIPCSSVEMISENAKSLLGAWRTGIWGECSVSCGGGTKIRNVMCLDAQGDSSIHCHEHDRPASSSPCNTDPCPDEVQWRYGEWSECNQTCNGGYQHRQAQCQTLKGENVADSFCQQTQIPHLVRQCENKPCVKNTYQWRTRAWSECSVNCGLGFQTRSVICEKINEYRIDEREVVDNSYCNQHTKPNVKKECQKEACRTDKFIYQWVHGPWSKCSVACGKGFQKRWVHCEKLNELRPNEKELVTDDYCNDADKPKYSIKCRRSCNTEYMWVSGPWSECRGSCGEKMKFRTIHCYHKSGKNMPDIFCSKLKRPKLKRRCKNRKCDSISCIDIKRMYKTDVDQEYPIHILGRNISIYCHDMGTNRPKEFLSLPAGEHENYAEFYSKRLINPDTCPSSKHKCCFEDTTPYVGRTSFRKIRLNVTSMHVIIDDYTFATTTGAWINYGEAGDCYSRLNCPQGTFSINLAGTGLQIASTVKWIEKGTNRMIDVQISHERRKIFGRCGGYCASCTTIDGLKLDVLPP